MFAQPRAAVKPSSLVSQSIHVDELLRKVGKDEEIAPLLDKVGERVGDMERVLREIRPAAQAGRDRALPSALVGRARIELATPGFSD